MTKAAKTPRSQATRERITEEARKLFGELGYQGTTVRLVASHAAIHPSLVMRYFGSKEGLFAVAAQFDLRLPDLSRITKKKRGEFLAGYFLQRWEGPDAGDELPALLQVSLSHPEGKRRLAKILKDQLHPAVLKIVGPERATTCSALIATQAIGLAFTRYVLELPPVAQLSKEEIVKSVGATFQRYLDNG